VSLRIPTLINDYLSSIKFYNNSKKHHINKASPTNSLLKINSHSSSYRGRGKDG
jgi:hypothetical protein